MSKDEEVAILLALKQVEQQQQQQDHQNRKLARIHDRLEAKDSMISLSGAVKVFRSYETHVQSAENHLQYYFESIVQVSYFLEQ